MAEPRYITGMVRGTDKRAKTLEVEIDSGDIWKFKHTKKTTGKELNQLINGDTVRVAYKGFKDDKSEEWINYLHTIEVVGESPPTDNEREHSAEPPPENEIRGENVTEGIVENATTKSLKLQGDEFRYIYTNQTYRKEPFEIPKEGDFVKIGFSEGSDVTFATSIKVIESLSSVFGEEEKSDSPPRQNGKEKVVYDSAPKEEPEYYIGGEEGEGSERYGYTVIEYNIAYASIAKYFMPLIIKEAVSQGVPFENINPIPTTHKITEPLAAQFVILRQEACRRFMRGEEPK